MEEETISKTTLDRTWDLPLLKTFLIKQSTQTYLSNPEMCADWNIYTSKPFQLSSFHPSTPVSQTFRAKLEVCAAANAYTTPLGSRTCGFYRDRGESKGYYKVLQKVIR